MKPSLNEIKKKTIFMVCIVAVLLALLVLRVAYWQIIRGDELSSKAKAQQQGSSIVTASRGDIYDRNGKVLAESATVNTLICNPKDIEADGDSEVIAARLAPVLNMDQNEILKIITKNSRYQVIKKRLTNEQTEAVKKLRDSDVDATIAKAFKGVYFENDSKRYYQFNVAPHILGFTGYDNNGLQGIELTFDDELMGRNGSIETNQSAKGTTLKDQQNEYLNSSQNGDDVVLTIDETIQHFLEKHDIPGIAGIDTRALTKILREKGTMNGMITTNENYHLDEIIPKLKAYNTGKVVEKVTCSEKSVLKGEGFKVALLDLGAKNNIARSLNERGCEVTIYPALTTAEEILAANPDGIMLSNGPGDPKECTAIIEELKKLYASDVPIFAICLGHQLMALANGADTHKMKYGHRGGNHPVKDLSTGRVYISSQNHGYVVDTDTLDPKVAKPAFVNVNDGTNEGLEYVGKNIFTVQFHPEACPGPQDSGYLFDRFLEMMGGEK